MMHTGRLADPVAAGASLVSPQPLFVQPEDVEAVHGGRYRGADDAGAPRGCGRAAGVGRRCAGVRRPRDGRGGGPPPAAVRRGLAVTPGAAPRPRGVEESRMTAE